MIREFVKCDVCGSDIPKEKRNRWHNINVVKHVRNNQNSDLSTSFHVCHADFIDLLVRFIGNNVIDAEHRRVLKRQFINKLGFKESELYKK